MTEIEKEELTRLYVALKGFERVPFTSSTLKSIQALCEASVEKLRKAGNLTTFDYLEISHSDHDRHGKRIDIVPAIKAVENVQVLIPIKEMLDNYNRKAKEADQEV